MEVTYIDHMGDDLRVVNAARVSFHKQRDEFLLDGDSRIRPTGRSDQQLLKDLAREGHWTPFSHVQITLREKVPIFVARQRFKHMVGFSYNEVSRRYVSDLPEFFTPTEWRKAAENKKQGSSDEVITHNKYGGEIAKTYGNLMIKLEEFYTTLIESGVAPEQARMVLPQSMYTEYYCTGSLAAWARAFRLRSDPHAQREIADLARKWNEIIGSIKELEHSWKALTCTSGV